MTFRLPTIADIHTWKKNGWTFGSTTPMADLDIDDFGEVDDAASEADGSVWKVTWNAPEAFVAELEAKAALRSMEFTSLQSHLRPPGPDAHPYTYAPKTDLPPVSWRDPTAAERQLIDVMYPRQSFNPMPWETVREQWYEYHHAVRSMRRIQKRDVDLLAQLDSLNLMPHVKKEVHDNLMDRLVNPPVVVPGYPLSAAMEANRWRHGLGRILP